MANITRSDFPRVRRSTVDMGYVFAHLSDGGKLKANRYLSFGSRAAITGGDLVSLVYKKDGTFKLCTTQSLDTEVGVVGYGAFQEGEALPADALQNMPKLGPFSRIKENATKSDYLFLGPMMVENANVYALLDYAGRIRLANDFELANNFTPVSRLMLGMTSL